MKSCVRTDFVCFYDRFMQTFLQCLYCCRRKYCHKTKNIKTRSTHNEDFHTQKENKRKTPANAKASLYVHWPYCKKRCTYCNFNKYIDPNVNYLRMTNCLKRETRTLIELADVQEITSVFFGGGTPSLAPSWTIGAILDTVDAMTSSQGQREVSLEVNPTDLETNKLRDFQKSGVNRVSVGVQTLDPRGLAHLGRMHSPSQSLKCVDIARNLFDKRVSVDLIFGWPGQSISDWLKELEFILPLCGNHVSLYQLTLERGTLLHKLVDKGSVRMLDEDIMDEMYLKAVEILSSHGFERYEVSNFTKQNHYCHHNASYWTGQSYIGVGPGAHGRFQPKGKPLREGRIQTLEPNNWMHEVEKTGHATRLVRSLTPLQQLEELFISGLRTKWGVTYEAWSSIADISMMNAFQNCTHVITLIEDDLLFIDSERICATDKGINILDLILPNLICVLNEIFSAPRPAD